MYPSQSIKLVKDDLQQVPGFCSTEVIGMKLEPSGEKIAQSATNDFSIADKIIGYSDLLHLHISTKQWIVIMVLAAHVEARKPAIE